MKELTIEEKAERYDKIIIEFKPIYDLAKEQGRIIDVEEFERIFPELKESEDERIRKEIIDYFQSDWAKEEGITRPDWIAWLKRIGKQKPADKVEPKFHEGEWITNGDYTGKIVEVKPLYYILQSQDGNIVDDTISHVDKQFHSFTIKDAKAGDVLVIQGTDFSYESIFIFNKIENNHINQYLHYFITDEGEEVCKVKSVGGFIGYVEENVHPATKEQRDLLFQKMHEAGYEWNAEKKELKKIEQKPVEWHREDEQNLNACLGYIPDEFLRRWLTDVIHTKYDKPTDKVKPIFNVGDKIQYLKGCGTIMTIEKIENGEYIFDNNMGHTTIESGNKWHLVEQNPTWSEEDETKIKSIIAFLKSPSLCAMDGNKGIIDESIKYLNSLKDKVQPQPKQEWSEEDETMATNIIIMLKEGASLHFNKNDIAKGVDWLKSLKDRYTWKPSEEQMEFLLKYAEQNNYDGSILTSLYQDLKKLKG